MDFLMLYSLHALQEDVFSWVNVTTVVLKMAVSFLISYQLDATLYKNYQSKVSKLLLGIWPRYI